MKRIILITGSNRGLGKATGLKLCEYGHEVIFTSRNLNNLKAIEQEVQAKKYNASFFELDVCNLDSIINLKKEIQKKYDHIDTLINNAGILNDRNDSILNLDHQLLHQTMNTNLFNPLYMIQQFQGLIKKSLASRMRLGPDDGKEGRPLSPDGTDLVKYEADHQQVERLD